MTIRASKSTGISREPAVRREDAARFLRRKGITTGLTRNSGRHSNLKKLDRAARIAAAVVFAVTEPPPPGKSTMRAAPLVVATGSGRSQP